MPIHNKKIAVAMKTSDGEQCYSDELMREEAVKSWHCRLRHTNIPVVKEMIAAGKYGMNNFSKKKQLSETCVETKSTKIAC